MLSSEPLAAAALHFTKSVVGGACVVEKKKNHVCVNSLLLYIIHFLFCCCAEIKSVISRVAASADSTATRVSPLAALLESATMVVLERIRAVVDTATGANAAPVLKALWTCAIVQLTALLQIDCAANAPVAANAQRLSLHQRAAELVRYAARSAHGACAIIFCVCGFGSPLNCAHVIIYVCFVVSTGTEAVRSAATLVSACVAARGGGDGAAAMADNVASVYLRVVGPDVLAAAVRLPEESVGLQVRNHNDRFSLFLLFSTFTFVFFK